MKISKTRLLEIIQEVIDDYGTGTVIAPRGRQTTKINVPLDKTVRTPKRTSPADQSKRITPPLPGEEQEIGARETLRTGHWYVGSDMGVDKVSKADAKTPEEALAAVETAGRVNVYDGSPVDNPKPVLSK